MKTILGTLTKILPTSATGASGRGDCTRCHREVHSLRSGFCRGCRLAWRLAG